MASRVPARSYGRQAKAKSPPKSEEAGATSEQILSKISEMLVDFQREAKKEKAGTERLLAQKVGKMNFERGRAYQKPKSRAGASKEANENDNDEPIARKTRTWTQYRREPSESSSCPTDDSDDPPREATTKSRAKGDWNTKPDTSPCTACQTAGIHCFRHIKYNPAAARAKVGPGPAYSSCQSCRSQAKKCDPGMSTAGGKGTQPRSSGSPKKRKKSYSAAAPRKRMRLRSHTRTIVEDVTLSADPTATLHALTAELLSLRNEMRSLKAEVGAWRGDAGL